jgi:hypothetical protein
VRAELARRSPSLNSKEIRINSVIFCVCSRGEADDGEKMLQAFAAIVKGQ